MLKILKLNKITKIFVLFSVMVFFLSTAYVPKANAATDVPKANAATDFPITDDNPVTVQIPQGMGAAPFSINVKDSGGRLIYVSASNPTTGAPINVRTTLNTNALPNLVSFDSVSQRVVSMIAWHFQPLTNYTLLVMPETTPANVTITMSKSENSMSWIYNAAGSTFEEKNTILPGQLEYYGLANGSQGYYNITVTSDIAQLGIGFGDSDGLSPDGSEAQILNLGTTGRTYTFLNKKLYSDSPNNGNKYSFYVSCPSYDANGGGYTIKVQKVGSF